MKYCSTWLLIYLSVVNETKPSFANKGWPFTSPLGNVLVKLMAIVSILSAFYPIWNHLYSKGKSLTIEAISGFFVVEHCWFELFRWLLKLSDIRALSGEGHYGVDVTLSKLSAVIKSFVWVIQAFQLMGCFCLHFTADLTLENVSH